MVPGLSQLQWVAAVVIVAIVIWSVQQVQVVNARLEAAGARTELSELKAAAVADARRLEQRWRDRLDEIAEQYEQERADAEQTHRDVVADLESGAARLRAHWQGCVATSDLSAAAQAAASADVATKLREQGAADLVRLGAQCDAEIRAWQGYARAVTGAGREALVARNSQLRAIKAAQETD